MTDHSGRVLSDRAGQASPGAATASPPSGDHPSRDWLMTDTNRRGEQLRAGDYVSIWDDGDHPYGEPARCPFCKSEQNYTELWYNGPGSPPSYSVCCGECGAQGPTSHGRFKGDHFGACLDAVEQWNRARDSDGNPQGGDGTAPSRSDDSAGLKGIAQSEQSHDQS